MTLSWTAVTSPSGGNGINHAVATSTTIYCAWTDGSNLHISYTTNNGTSWTACTVNSSSTLSTVSAFALGNGVFLISTNASEFWRSTDGVTFNLITGPAFTGGSFSVRHTSALTSDGAGHWVAYSQGGQEIKSSDGGATWGSPSSNFSVVQSDSGALYDGTLHVAVDAASPSNVWTSSNNGTSWSSSAISDVSDNFANIAFGNSLYMAMGTFSTITGGTLSAMAAASGISLPGTFSGTSSLTWSFDKSVFVAGAQNNEAATSTNGTSWTDTGAVFSSGNVGTIVSGRSTGTLAFDSNAGLVSQLTGSSGPVVTISPTSANLLWGTQLSFTATGDDGGGYTWSCTLGSITPGGIYTAPGPTSVGMVDTVKVALTDNPSVFATASVTIINATKNVYGAARVPATSKPIQIANAGTIFPRVYMPGENTTIKSQS